MVSFGIPPLTSRQNLGRNAAFPPLLVHFLRDFSGDLLLLGVVIENGGTVLCADIGALSIDGSGVVHLVEELKKRSVGDGIRVVGDLKRFGIWLCG